MLCPACRAKAEAGLTDQWQRKKFQHHSALKGFIVVLVILLIGATAWVGVYTSGHSAVLIGVAMTVLSFWGYQHMAGRMKKGSVMAYCWDFWPLCFSAIISVWLLSWLSPSVSSRKLPITSALMFIPTFLKDPINREVYFLQLGLSVLAVALAAAPMLWFVHYSWHHKERLESLEEPTA